MNELVSQLTSLNYWVSVVIVGVLCSLIASYLKPRIDKLIGSVSRHYRLKSERRLEERKALISELSADQHKQVIYAISINFCMLRSISIILIGILVMAWKLDLPNTYRLFGIFLSVFSVVSNIMAISYVFEAWDDLKVLEEAQRTPTTPLTIP